MKATDPVCGMTIDTDKAAAQEHHGGQAYFFCSAQCHARFKQDPDKYARKGRPGEKGSGGSKARGG